MRGILPLFPGDLMVMVGSFQEHMVHKTLPRNRITGNVLQGYRAVNQFIGPSVGRLLEETHRPGCLQRAVITFRKIVTYCVLCPMRPCCPGAPTGPSAPPEVEVPPVGTLLFEPRGLPLKKVPERVPEEGGLCTLEELPFRRPDDH